MTENDEQMIRDQMYMISQNRPDNPDTYTYYFGTYINKSGNIYTFQNVMQCNNNRNNFTMVPLEGTRTFISDIYHFVMAPPYPQDGKKKKKK
jgi:hypothetical protein